MSNNVNDSMSHIHIADATRLYRWGEALNLCLNFPIKTVNLNIFTYS
jgi:hypothetical protein